MKSNPSEPNADMLVRMFAILKRLETDRCTVHRLAALTKKTIRTVQRDIDLLQRSGFPIAMDPESREFYLVSDYGVPTVALTFSEALATLILLQENGTSTEPLFEDAQKAALKIASGVSPELLDQIGRIQSEIHRLSGPANEETDRSDRFFAVLNAMNDGKTLKIRYKSPVEPDDLITTFRPYVIVWGKRSWYTIGYTGLFGEIRTLKIGRILEWTETGETFTRPSGFALDEFLGNAWSMIPERGADRDVVLKFSPLVAQNVAEVRWHKTQQTRTFADGSLEVRFRVAGLREISWWILGYGGEVEAVSPPALRQMIRDQLDKAREQYKDD